MDEAEVILNHARAMLGAGAGRVETRLRFGHPAEEILSEAEEQQCTAIVVGERQHHGVVTRFLLGATAERVVEHAPCPVIVAKGEIREVRHLLLCDSGVTDPSLLETFSAQLPELLQRVDEVTVLHVMSHISAGPGVRGRQLRADTEELIAEHTPEGELLERALEQLDELHVPAEPLVRHGRVVEQILKEGKTDRHDLVVIGAHRGEGWRRILLDDLTRQIITRIDRPVLVIR
jgi:nucleotide-binding universal stress UspA family protein